MTNCLSLHSDDRQLTTDNRRPSSLSSRPCQRQPERLAANRVRNISILGERREVLDLKPRQNVHAVVDRRAWVSDEIVYHRVTPCPLAVRSDISQDVFGD